MGQNYKIENFWGYKNAALVILLQIYSKILIQNQSNGIQPTTSYKRMEVGVMINWRFYVLLKTKIQVHVTNIASI